jgi:hypothetical protein
VFPARDRLISQIAMAVIPRTDPIGIAEPSHPEDTAFRLALKRALGSHAPA